MQQQHQQVVGRKVAVDVALKREEPTVDLRFRSSTWPKADATSEQVAADRYEWAIRTGRPAGQDLQGPAGTQPSPVTELEEHLCLKLMFCDLQVPGSLALVVGFCCLVDWSTAVSIS